MRPSVNPRVTGNLIRKLLLSVNKRAAEPRPPMQHARIVYLHWDTAGRYSGHRQEAERSDHAPGAPRSSA